MARWKRYQPVRRRNNGNINIGEVIPDNPITKFIARRRTTKVNLEP